MEDKLKNLRDKMNRTVLKKGAVSEVDKERLYRKALQSREIKRSPKRLGPVLSIASCLILLIIFTSYGYTNNIVKKQIGDKESSRKITGMNETTDREAKELIDGEKLPLFPSENEIKKNRNSIPTEEQFINSIHGMTHQKVLADEKWGLYEMNDESIANMLDILDKVKSQETYEHYDFYYETLTQWKKGNFENAVDVHNQIWRWSGGTTGKATRLLTDAEEQEFIEKNYD
ncbi:hypothetical protein IQ283_02345 [Alkalihalobacillus hwajinpoensis]|uniref:DUF6241 domain-containing protein n=1 Tax=Guptibacillus hwajinpoensis TaxID=208199 RepID=UPI0018831CE0|nr:DUF6241 domain-containing protein [Pseudalkalibacillus hwajinpoensis]MBF0705431.1 hypothetical protein [Pseudalkalibacillus hwajinpoensis]